MYLKMGKNPSWSSSNPVTVGHCCDHTRVFLSRPISGVLLCLVAFSVTGFLMNMRFCCFAIYTYHFILAILLCCKKTFCGRPVAVKVGLDGCHPTGDLTASPLLGRQSLRLIVGYAHLLRKNRSLAFLALCPVLTTQCSQCP